jgi:transposase InsO family protein
VNVYFGYFDSFESGVMKRLTDQNNPDIMLVSGVKNEAMRQINGAERVSSRVVHRIDNGTEFIAKAARSWLSLLGVKTLYIEPGSSWENRYVESFNGSCTLKC